MADHKTPMGSKSTAQDHGHKSTNNYKGKHRAEDKPKPEPKSGK